MKVFFARFSIYIFSCSRSLPLSSSSIPSLPNPTFTCPSSSSSSYFVCPPAPWPCLPPYPSLSSLSLSHRCSITPHSLPLSLFYPSAFSSIVRSAGSPPAVSSSAAAEQQLACVCAGCGGRKVSAAQRAGDEGERRTETGRGGDLLFGILSAASVPALTSLLDRPSPGWICLLLLLWECFLEAGGGGRSPPPSSLRTVSRASSEEERG